MTTVLYKGAPTRVDPKDPDSVVDYQADWSLWLADAGDDKIASSTWLVPDGITMESDTFDDTTATIWLSGGTAGQIYKVTNRITTASPVPRTEDRTLLVPVQEM